MRSLFVPGWGASASLYAVPAHWQVLAPPPFRGAATIAARFEWLTRRLDEEEGPVVLGGHSMGAALAALAAVERPRRVHRLVLLGPAGLPLTKPLRDSLLDFCRQLTARVYPTREAVRGMLDVLSAPVSALRLARAVRSLDLGAQLRVVAARDVPVEVVACSSDTLTPPLHCRRFADLAAANYVELELDGGHMWMLREPAALAAVLG